MFGDQAIHLVRRLVQRTKYLQVPANPDGLRQIGDERALAAVQGGQKEGRKMEDKRLEKKPKQDGEKQSNEIAIPSKALGLLTESLWTFNVPLMTS